MITKRGYIPELRQKDCEFKLSKNIDQAEKFFLEQFKNPLKLYIPPGNTLSPKCANILINKNYTLFNYPGIYKRSRNSLIGYRISIERAFSVLIHKMDLYKPYKENKYSNCYNSIPLLAIDSRQQLDNITHECSRKGYPFIIALHNWELDLLQPKSTKRFGNKLIEIIEHLKNNFNLINFKPSAIKIR